MFNFITSTPFMCCACVLSTDEHVICDSTLAPIIYNYVIEALVC